MAFHFINADLEIYSNHDLEPIRVAFAKYGYRFAEMHCGEVAPGCYEASFEVHPDRERDDQTAEEKIHAFCDSILEFKGEPSKLWKSATRRVIDVGYQTDDNCKTFKDLFPRM